MRPRDALFAIIVVGAAAACGGGGTSYPTMSSGGDGNTGGGGTPPPNTSATSTVTIADYSFSPSAVTIKVGQTVEWTNGGAVAHTATADAGAFNSGQLAGASGGAYGYGGTGGGTYTKTFTTAGTFSYHCANHTYMTGTVTVTP